jgi:hypothetical protein
MKVGVVQRNKQKKKKKNPKTKDDLYVGRGQNMMNEKTTN